MDNKPINSEIYYNLGNAYSIQEKYKEAIKYFLKAIKENPNNSETFYNLGNSQFMDKQYNEALLSYESCEKISGISPSLLLMKARTLIEMTEYEKAKKILTKLIEKDKNNETYFYVFGNLWEKKGYIKKAIEYYEVINFINDFIFRWLWRKILILLRLVKNLKS